IAIRRSRETRPTAHPESPLTFGIKATARLLTRFSCTTPPPRVATAVCQSPSYPRPKLSGWTRIAPDPH
ncbi:TPA_asm: UL50.5 sORF 2, partial [Human alphaherpesvirus 1]